MRKSSRKQIEASRSNGAKSKGPQSIAGKRKSSQNAIKYGVFSSRQVVIPQLCEKESDFEQVKQNFLHALPPSNSLSESFANDAAENFWRRERVRREQQRELRTRLASLELKNKIAREQAVERLKSRFFVLFRELAISFGEVGHPTEAIRKELEEIRKRLSSTTLGIGFLLEVLRSIEISINESTPHFPTDEALAEACSGFGEAEAFEYQALHSHILESSQWNENYSTIPASNKRNWPAIKEIWVRGMATDREESHGSQTTEIDYEKELREKILAQRCNWLRFRVQKAIKVLRARRQQIRKMEAAEASNRVSRAIVDANSNRFSRAETVYERRMYRALGGYAATNRYRAEQQLLPGVKLSDSDAPHSTTEKRKKEISKRTRADDNEQPKEESSGPSNRN